MTGRPVLALLVLGVLAACNAEKRVTGPTQPQTAPNGAADPRIAMRQSRFEQISQGGRYFAWYGCGSCHAQGAPGIRELGDPHRRNVRGFDQVYRAIAGHPGVSPPYANRIPADQLWQLTAYVQSLTSLDPGRRRRQDLDQKGEATGETWSGPVR